MCVCVCVCVFVCMSVCMCVCVHECLHVFLYLCACFYDTVNFAELTAPTLSPPAEKSKSPSTHPHHILQGHH